LNILQKEPERVKKLWANAKFMKDSLEAMGLPVGQSKTPIVPIVVGDEYRSFALTMRLLEEGVYVNPAIAPAVEPGCALLRTSYTPTHTREQLEFALRAFEKVLKIEEKLA
jgi:8-amino-7-oxononanoate synthase